VYLTKSKTGLVKLDRGYVIYEDRKLPYSIITNKKLKNLYIEVHPQDGVLVKNPNFSIQKVHAIVQEKAKWIFQKTIQLGERNSIAKIYKEEDKILLFGEKLSLHVKSSLEKFYREQTEKIVNKTIEKYAPIMNVTPQRVGFRKAKKRWGSCSGKNDLSFNTSIAQLPLECIEYIVVHELAHIKHKHHKRAFWEFVSEFIPRYKECEQDIKQYSPSLT
jgi:predicted metal-dependent hydrolase